jgi:hypothetical protein
MILNRRKFFKWLGAGTAAAVVAPTVLKALEPLCVAPTPKYVPITLTDTSTGIVISTYAEYSNFSSFATKAALDDAVYISAAQLGKAHAERIKSLLSDADCSVQHVGI